MVDRYTALAHPTQADFNRHSDNPRFTISPSRAAALAKYGLNTDKPVLAFCPGAEYGPAKRWPARHFAELGRRYLAEALQVWLFGSQKISTSPKKSTDFQTASAPTSAAKPTFPKRLTCSPAPTSCCDSGLMHLAAALDRKLVAAYGSSSPDHTRRQAKSQNRQPAPRMLALLQTRMPVGTHRLP